MKSRRKRLEAWAGTVAFRTIQKWLSRKDILQAERIGQRIGRMAFRIGKSRRARSMYNLRLAYPEMTDEERMVITKGVFEHFGLVMCDFVRSASRTKEEVLSSITSEGTENLDRGLELGKGVIILTGHYGNWERLAQWLTLSGYKLAVVVRDANGELNDDVLRLRQAAGVEVISRGNAARGILTRLKRNEVAGILPDQNAGDAFIPFFGKPAGTVLGPAVLSLRSGASPVPVYCYRTGPGKYHVVALPPIPVEGRTPEEIMVDVNASLESVIRLHPEQYLWIHDRYKSARQKGLV
jgi:KDO2-lipid IV(A) lauroyltransferase